MTLLDLHNLNLVYHVDFTQIVALFSLAWAFALLFIKMSILLLYRRIFAVKKFLLVTNIMGGFVFCWFLIVIFELAFVCRPYAFNWDKSIHGGKCGPQIKLWLSNGILHVIVDTIILILPMPMVWRLNTKLSNKISLSIVFGLGFLYVKLCIPAQFFQRRSANRNDVTSIPVVGCLRLRSLVQVDFRDPSFTVPNAFLWSMLEPPFAIICSSLPIIKPLTAELAPTFITERTHFRNKGPFSIAANCKPDGCHQKAFHRLEEGVNSPKATITNVLLDGTVAGDGPKDQ